MKEITNHRQEGNKKKTKKNEIHKSLLPLAAENRMPFGLVGEYAYRPVISSRGCSHSPWRTSPLFSPPSLTQVRTSCQLNIAVDLL